MNQRPRSHDRIALAETLSPVSFLVPPAAATALIWATSVNSVALTAGVCAYAILQLAWGSYLLWKKQNRGGLPILAMIISTYWIFFALPLFWGERVLRISRFIPVSEDSITKTLEMVLLSVVCLWAGMQLPLDVPAARRLPDIDERASSSWVYLRVVLMFTTLLGSFTTAVYSVSSDVRNVMEILTSTIPTVAFLLLFRRCCMRGASPVDRWLLIAAAMVRIVGALASGWLGPVINLGLTVTALFVILRRKIPWSPILITIVSILFFQAGKQVFRQTYWGADADMSAGVFERARFWLDTSASNWSDSFEAGGQATPKELASKTLDRTSLLAQVARVLEMTPIPIPFQNGQTYSYLAVTLIPRFLWPEKPSFNEANRFYQLAYGLSDAKGLETVSIAVGSMGEGYMNFGWPGVVMVMCGIGAVLRIYERAFIANQTNTVLMALGVALLPRFLGIEGQLVVYISGLVQQVFLAFLVFLPITTKRPRLTKGLNRPEVSAVRVRSTANP